MGDIIIGKKVNPIIIGSAKTPEEALRLSKKYTDEQIAKIKGFRQKVVQALPQEGDPATLYFVPSSNPQTSNIHDEYIWVVPDVGDTFQPHWECIGSTAILFDIEDRPSLGSGKLLVTLNKGLQNQSQYLVSREEYTAPATPTFSPASGGSGNGSLIVTIACDTAGVTIQYSTNNGSSWTTGTSVTLGQDSSAKSKSYTLKAKAVNNTSGLESEIATATYTVKRKLAAPIIGNPTGNANSASRNVVISGASGSTLYYTITDGTTETTGNVLASAAESARTLTISTKGTWAIYVTAKQSDWVDSNQAEKTGIVVKQIATPSISASATDYDSERTITIDCGTTGVSIYYRYSTSGTWVPYNSSDKPKITSTKTVYVKAEKTDWTTATNNKSITVAAAHTHYGVSTRNTADATTFGDMTAEIKANNPTGVYTFTNGTSTAKYMWIFVPASQADITEMNNSVNQNQIGQFDKSSQNVTINNIAYKWYRSKSTIASDSTTLYINRKA